MVDLCSFTDHKFVVRVIHPRDHPNIINSLLEPRRVIAATSNTAATFPPAGWINASPYPENLLRRFWH